MSGCARVNSSSHTKPALLVACLATASLAICAEQPHVRITQALEADGAALPRPVIGPGSVDPTILPFHVAVDYQCPVPGDRPQVFVSIGDSWRLQDASELPTPLIVRVDVPIRQLQWLMQPDSECASVAGQRKPDETDDATGFRYYRLPDRVAGFATLSCMAKDGAVSASTSIAPLSVWLSCPSPGAAPSSSP